MGYIVEIRPNTLEPELSTVKVSIITVVFNGEKTIRETIESVLIQDYTSLEYIIIDGNSSDSTIKIIESFGERISDFVSEPDLGIYDAMNKGISRASGDIIGLLNADDIYDSPQVISEVVQKFTASGVDAVYGDLLYVDATNLNSVRRNWKAGMYKSGSFLWGWMPPHPTFFIRRNWYQRYGNYRLDLGSAADYELMLRMVHKHQAKLAYIPRVLVRMRAGGISNTSFKNRFLANQNDRKAWIVNQLRPYPFTSFLKPFRKILQFIQ
jgi:glycosyltransferase involved in cell wall biosynthesis